MRVFILVLVAVLLPACTWVDVTEQGEEVRLRNVDEISACKRLGSTVSVGVDTIAGIHRSEEKLATELATLARNQAARMNGNTVAALGPVDGDQQTFGVYSCPR